MPPKRTLASIARSKAELKICQEDRQLRELIASNRSKKYNVDDIFLIKKIRSHEWRILEKGKVALYYLVQWDGIYATPRFDSWEPSSNLDQNTLVAEYNAETKINPAKLEKKVNLLLREERKLLKIKEEKEKRRKIEEEFHKGVSEMDVDSQNYLCIESAK